MNEITVSDSTYKALELAARLTGMTPGAVVDRLVAQSHAAPDPVRTSMEEDDDSDASVHVYADYNGRRVKGNYNRVTKRIDITSGPLSGTSYKSPSAAARAVVASEKPDVNSNRNGWGFWCLADGSGDFLQSIRHEDD